MYVSLFFKEMTLVSYKCLNDGKEKLLSLDTNL